MNRLCILLALLAACGDDGKASSLLSTEALDFGQVACGATQVPRSFIVANPSQAAFSFTTAFEKGTQYMVQPASGFVLPGEQLELTVYSAAIPATSAVDASLYADTLTVTTDIPGDAPHPITISQVAKGAIIEVSSMAVAIPGVHTITSPGTAELTIRNVGNIPVNDVRVTTHGGFAFSPAATATLAPGAELTGTITYRPTTEGAETSPIEIVVGDSVNLCGATTTVSASAEGSLAGMIPTKLVFTGGLYYRNKSQPTLFAILPGGYVASLGGDDRGVRGAGSAVATAALTLVRGADDHPIDGVIDLNGDRAAACALRSDRSVYCWGNDTLARGRVDVPAQPYAKVVVADADAFALTYGVRCIATSGSTGCFANQASTTSLSWTPTGAKQLVLHTHGGYALEDDGTVVSFGSNEVGERGNADPGNSPPSAVTGLTDVKMVIASGGKPDKTLHGGCALKNDGTVWCWGSGHHGRNGQGNQNDTDTPVQVMIDATTPLEGVTTISGAHGHRCAATADEVYCWGNGRYGKLGRPGTSDDNPYAQPVTPSIAGVTSIATARRGTCVLQANGRVTCFGQTLYSEDATQRSYDGFVAPTP